MFFNLLFRGLRFFVDMMGLSNTEKLDCLGYLRECQWHTGRAKERVLKYRKLRYTCKGFLFLCGFFLILHFLILFCLLRVVKMQLITYLISLNGIKIKDGRSSKGIKWRSLDQVLLKILPLFPGIEVNTISS